MLEISHRGQWITLGEKSIRTRSLNYAKGQAMNFCFQFEEMRYFWGKLDSGWSESVQENGGGLLFVSRQHYDCVDSVAFLRVEWLDPQPKLFDDDIGDLRIHESWTHYRLRRQLEKLLSENGEFRFYRKGGVGEIR